MGLFKAMFKELQKHGEAALGEALGGGGPNKKVAPPPTDPNNPPTRWEKAVVALNGIVGQVAQFDPDGVDVVCFGGDGDHDFYRNVKDAKGLEGLATAKSPGGPCHMGGAMSVVLAEAFARGFDARPCSILVLTAGRPDDHAALDAAIEDAATKIAAIAGTAAAGAWDEPLTITFVQVGDDAEAEKYLKHLDENFAKTSSSDRNVDIVDTVKDEDIQDAVGEMKKGGGGAVGGALFGAFAGAALGVGGMYLMNQMNAKKRTEGWNGQWKATYGGEEIATLTVVDDRQGNLTVDGFPDCAATAGSYAENAEGGYNIQFADPNDTAEPVYGTVEDQHTITWSDGTRWEEVPPPGGHWAVYAAAGAAGAAAGGASFGAAGHLLEKKFFNKASKKTPSDYVILLDRSSMMAVPDAGK